LGFSTTQITKDINNICDILEGIEELEDYKIGGYCSECGSCGEDGCCSGSMCTHNKCKYGDIYTKDYEYHKLMTDELYDALNNINKELALQILHKCYDQVYKNNKNSN
jgi:hypothetical protein